MVAINLLLCVASALNKTIFYLGISQSYFNLSHSIPRKMTWKILKLPKVFSILVFEASL